MDADLLRYLRFGKERNPTLSVVPSVLHFPFSLLPTRLLGLARSAGSAAGFPSGSRMEWELIGA